MSSFLYSLGRWSFNFRKTVVAIWIAVLVLAGAGALFLNQGTDDAVSIPGTESQEALDQLAATFPQVSGASAQIVIAVPAGDAVTDEPYASAISDIVEELGGFDQVAAATDPLDGTIDGLVSEDGEAAIVQLQMTGELAEITDDTRTALEDAASELSAALPDAQVSIGGQLFSQAFPELTITEAIGVVVALIVLFVTFGSLLTATFPLITALLGVGITMALIFTATAVGQINSTTPMLALMLGLAVGIDYALFILSRHQDQLRDGLDPEESTAQSVATAGSAVIFAGVTVVIALVGLAVANIPFLTTMGVAAAVGVSLAVLISISLLPAILGFAGMKVLPKKQRRALLEGVRGDADDAQSLARTGSELQQTNGNQGAPAPHADSEATSVTPPAAPKKASFANRFFAGWVRIPTRWPIPTIAVVLLIGVALAIPAASLRLALPDAGQLPADDPARVTYDLVEEHFGAGANGPLIVTGSIVSSNDPLGLMDDLGAEIATFDGVDSVALSTPNETADTGIVQVVPTGGPHSEETAALVKEIRDNHDYFEDKYGISISVTGFTAVGIDISDRLGNALLPFGLLVVGLSLVLLMMVFRSIWVPIKATVGYLLSVVASFGVVALVFEHGVFADALHIPSQGPVISFMPIILMGVLFGLAMDYEVFLVSRMREEYVHTKDARGAIRSGFRGSAKVVTAAAVIMLAVFAAFVPEGDTNIKPIALGLATGIFVDAFIVRMLFVPAVLQLLGDKAWWMPKWLDRALPHFDVEGESIHKELALRNWPEDGPYAIATQDLGLADEQQLVFRGLTLRVRDGEVLSLRGEPLATSIALSTLAGRVPASEGIAKIAEYALSARASSVRNKVALITLRESENALALLRTRLAEQPRIAMIDGLDSIPEGEERRSVLDFLEAARAERRADKPLTLVFATQLDLPGAFTAQPVTLNTSPTQAPAGSAQDLPKVGAFA
ncbi:MMPL family transporter [Humidisolicoccus flavus]|uniref:MMPL family transporter n=1 Tax=Humidisolicoccus flavus TaxID=3111414 RepID=UPI0032434BFC